MLCCRYDKRMPYTQIPAGRWTGTCYTASTTSICPTLRYTKSGRQVRVILQARQAYALHSGTGRQVDRYVLYFRHDKRMPYTQVGRWTGTCYTASTTNICPTFRYRQAGGQVRVILQARQAYALHLDTGRQVDR